MYQFKIHRNNKLDYVKLKLNQINKLIEVNKIKKAKYEIEKIHKFYNNQKIDSYIYLLNIYELKRCIYEKTVELRKLAYLNNIIKKVKLKIHSSSLPILNLEKLHF